MLPFVVRRHNMDPPESAEAATLSPASVFRELTEVEELQNLDKISTDRHSRT